MKKRTAFVSVLALGLVMGACDSTGVNSNGFLAEPGPILFVSDESGNGRQLYSMRPDGTGIRQLTRSSSRLAVGDAVWSPDGALILLKRSGRIENREGVNDLFFVPYSLDVVDSNGRTIQSCAFEDVYFVQSFLWAPNAEAYLLGTGRTPRQNYSVNWLSCARTLFQAPPPTGLQGRSTEGIFVADWSQDGERLLGTADYTTHDEATDTTVRNVSVGEWTPDGDSLASFGEVGTEYFRPIWSHDESHIAVGRYTEEGWSLFRVSPTGQERVQLTGAEYTRVIPVAWSPDDSKILVKARHLESFTNRILVVDAGGAGVTDITPFPGEVSVPTSWLSN